MLYFAYGANTNLENMKHRCPNAKLVGTIELPDYRLVFRGVADIEPAAHNVVLGVIWDITDTCEESLDIFEGFPHLYRKENFCVEIGKDKKIEDVMFYTMNRTNYDLPNESYFRCIEDGYIQNGLATDLLYESLGANT
jgi:gamma-glutamylcyclotransferase (GGCT)/AIG2-like uncharacterized protein YtfP